MAAGHGVNFVEQGLNTVFGEGTGVQFETFASAVLVGVLLLVFAYLAKAKIQSAENPLIPDEGLSNRNLFELIAEFVLRLGDMMMGAHNRKYLPFVATIFCYIFFMNLLGLVPGFSGSTDSVPFNLGIALTVFIMYNFWGVREVGIINYIKHFGGPIWWLFPFLFVVELISHVVRPLSLSLRLFGNMTADHAILGAFTEMTRVVVPVFFYFMGTFVCFMQAFVFTLLTMLYIQSATAHEEGH